MAGLLAFHLFFLRFRLGLCRFISACVVSTSAIHYPCRCVQRSSLQQLYSLGFPTCYALNKGAQGSGMSNKDQDGHQDDLLAGLTSHLVIT